MKKSLIIWGFLAFTMLVMPGCKDDEATVDPGAEQALFEKQLLEIEAHLASNSIAATKDIRGVYYREVVEENAEGELIERGDVAILQYKISRLDGTLIDASSPQDPLLITYSNDRYYFPVALFLGLENIRVGSTYRNYVPARYGYNNNGKKYSNDRGIVEDAILILEYQVLGVAHSLQEIEAQEQQAIQAWLQAENITAEALPNGLHKQVLKAGSGEVVDTQDSVMVYYKGYYLDKAVFDENTSGDGFKVIVDKTGLVQGFTQAIKTMQLGEKSLFILPSAQAYGKNGGFVLPRADLQAMQEKGVVGGTISAVPPFTPLVFEIEVRSLLKKP